MQRRNRILKMWIDPSLNMQLIFEFVFFFSVFNIFSTPAHPIALLEPSIFKEAIFCVC